MNSDGVVAVPKDSGLARGWATLVLETANLKIA